MGAARSKTNCNHDCNFYDCYYSTSSTVNEDLDDDDKSQSQSQSQKLEQQGPFHTLESSELETSSSSSSSNCKNYNNYNHCNNNDHINNSIYFPTLTIFFWEQFLDCESDETKWVTGQCDDSSLRYQHRILGKVWEVLRMPMCPPSPLILLPEEVHTNDTDTDTEANHHHHHHHCFRAGRNGTSSDSGNDTNNAEWILHMQDTAALVESPRLVGRALLEASDVFKAAIKVLKSSSRGASKKATTTNTNKNKNTHTDDGVETETETKRKQFFRLRKKLEFYLSWTLRHPVASKALLGVSAGEEIRDWIEERRQFWNDYNNNGNDECTTTSSNSNSNIDIDNNIDNSSKRIAIIDGLDDRADDNAITTLKFPANPSQNNNGGRKYSRTESTTEQLQPLMVEVQSRRKQQTKTRGNSNK
mmetsp:Transcript_4866/g.11858  ORF Transcript_4866/g.11858 Transcript_4866/m.11858 type:complete len:416 (-) Transcript_4866:42-1289(-)